MEKLDYYDYQMLIDMVLDNREQYDEQSDEYDGLTNIIENLKEMQKNA